MSEKDENMAAFIRVSILTGDPLEELLLKARDRVNKLELHLSGVTHKDEVKIDAKKLN